MAGDEEAAKRRIKALEEIPLLEINDEAIALSHDLMAEGLFPQKTPEDALHVWNCGHIANAERYNNIVTLCHSKGYGSPIFCTPEELMGE